MTQNLSIEGTPPLLPLTHHLIPLKIISNEFTHVYSINHVHEKGLFEEITEEQQYPLGLPFVVNKYETRRL